MTYEIAESAPKWLVMATEIDKFCTAQYLNRMRALFIPWPKIFLALDEQVACFGKLTK